MDQQIGILTDCREQIFSEETLDFFLRYSGSLELANERYRPDCIQRINQDYVIAHYNASVANIYSMSFGESYGAIPKCYTTMEQSRIEDGIYSSNQVLEAMGVSRLRRLPSLDLYGNETLIGFLDTGIDYQNPLFRNPDGTSRIASIWDQTVQDGTTPQGFEYGAEYTREQLNLALSSQEPLSVVPEQDTNGHGTFVAGLAAGNISRETDFSGVAPQAQIVMVKLKQAKRYLREYFVIPEGVDCYQETDLVQGARYLMEVAKRERKPLVICITAGTNSGGHDGIGIFDEILNELAGKTGVAVVTTTGDEAGYALHYQETGSDMEYEEVELRTGEREPGFTLELWASSLNLYSVEILSPTGELISRTIRRGNQSQRLDFVFEPTIIYLNYYMVESRSGEQLIQLRIYEPTPGIWRFRVFTEQEFGGSFNIWLPVHKFLQNDTYFLRANPDITITGPGNAVKPITTASYRVSDKSISLYSGRGFTRSGRIKPDIAAPGVAVYGPLPGEGYSIRSGGGLAAALTAGACALLLEWAITMGRRPEIDNSEIKRLLKGGAEKEGILYPSREWGFGRLNVYDAFEELRIVANSR